MNSEKISTIKLAKNGNPSAIEKLLKSEQANIYSMLLYLKKDEEDILDITQNVLVKLSKKIYQLKNENNYKTWLNQIILNTYYDYLRKKKKQNVQLRINKNNEENIFDIPDESKNPSNFILENELDLLIKTSINNLPIQYKIPIALRELQGLSYDEISNITKTTLGTVKSRIARARAKIKNDITKYMDE